MILYHKNKIIGTIENEFELHQARIDIIKSKESVFYFFRISYQNKTLPDYLIQYKDMNFYIDKYGIIDKDIEVFYPEGNVLLAELIETQMGLRIKDGEKEQERGIL